jgi:hypothetical protein
LSRNSYDFRLNLGGIWRSQSLRYYYLNELKQNHLVENRMTKKVVTFEYEKETKNSVRYKEVPDEGTAPIVGSLYVQKWFAGNSKTIEVTIEKKD